MVHGLAHGVTLERGVQATHGYAPTAQRSIIREPHPEPTNPSHLPQPDYNALRGLAPRTMTPAHAHAKPQLNLGPLEDAFRWPEPPRPATNYDALDTRHIWSFGNEACPVPSHKPAVPLPPPAAEPLPDPPIAIIDRVAGTVTWPATDDVYEGETGPYGQPEGQGRLVYARSGDAYEGGFANGKRHGRGAYHHGRSGVVTVGNFAADRLVGVAVRWSAERRRAWSLIDGEIDMQFKKVSVR